MQFSSSPISSLVFLFIVSKAVLLLVACASPGPGYDTSTHLIDSGRALNVNSSYSYLPSRLVRWDAIYFVSSAKRGYIYEQEWAFGWGFSRIISIFASLISGPGTSMLREAWAGIIIANFSHLLSSLVLYYLAKLLQAPGEENINFPFIAACLHIFAPAGMFLSAPYGESLFSLLNFVGIFAYCLSRKDPPGREFRGFSQELLLVSSGLLFGLAATVRSNSILSGAIFVYDLFSSLPHLPKLLSSFNGLRYLACLASAGILLATGFLVPQIIAYSEYCTPHVTGSEDIRIWCRRTFPSISTFVQAHYWNVGFLRYWTVSNIPLFGLAIPMLTLLFYTGCQVLRLGQFKEGQPESSSVQTMRFYTGCLRRIAIPQVVLAFLALTSFHVQIITRIASGYPLPYLWLASILLERTKKGEHGQKLDIAKATTRYMVIYALVQGSLFSSFLPPA